MKRQLLSIFILTILLASALAISSSFSKAQVGTDISGIISADTTWTQENGPYTLTGNILVENGVTLTVQPGTVVELNDWYIQINGTIQAVGNSINPIHFNSGQLIFTSYCEDWNDTTSSGCIVENAYISFDKYYSSGEYPPIHASSSPKISNCTITTSVKQVAVMLRNESNATICNSTIISPECGISIGEESAPTIVNNAILGSYNFSGEYANWMGISIGSNGPFVIQGNLIANFTRAINIYNKSVNSLIQNNTIVLSDNGILYCDGQSTVQFNNIYDNTHNCQVFYANDFNATNNWWGTANVQAINQSIWDFKNDFALGNVSFVPFLSSPNTAAPSYVNATTNTGGSITPSGVVRLNYGDNQSFTVTPDSGYHITGVYVNGTMVGALSDYMIENISGATNITATFAVNTPIETPTTTPTTNPTQQSSEPTTGPTQAPTTSPTLSVPEIPSILTLTGLMIALSIATLILKKQKTPPTIRV